VKGRTKPNGIGAQEKFERNFEDNRIETNGFDA